MRLSRTIPCNNNNNTVLFTLVRFDTHLHTHTPYYAVRNRSEMFDLLHVLSTAEKGLVSTDFQFIGIKDEGQRAIRNGSFIMDYMEKCENYIFKLYLFSTAAGRISFTEDSIYT